MTSTCVWAGPPTLSGASSTASACSRATEKTAHMFLPAFKRRTTESAGHALLLRHQLVFLPVRGLSTTTTTIYLIPARHLAVARLRHHRLRRDRCPTTLARRFLRRGRCRRTALVSFPPLVFLPPFVMVKTKAPLPEEREDDTAHRPWSKRGIPMAPPRRRLLPLPRRFSEEFKSLIYL